MLVDPRGSACFLDDSGGCGPCAGFQPLRPGRGCGISALGSRRMKGITENLCHSKNSASDESYWH